MSTKIQLKLNTKSIDDAIKEVQGRKQMLPRRVKVIQEVVSDMAVKIAQEKCRRYAIYDDELSNSISAKTVYKDGKFTTYITAGAESAAFFEFGTGIRGQEHPHPNANRRHWVYGDDWYTQADGKPMNKLYGWKPYFGEDLYFHTYGQESKPFMYETIQELRELLPYIVSEVFKNVK